MGPAEWTHQPVRELRSASDKLLTKMKAVTLIALFAALLAVVSSRPDMTDKPRLTLDQVKAEFGRKKACVRDCTKVKYEPLCVGKDGQRPQSFASECVLNNYNCEHNDTLRKMSPGECPGGHGVRLS